MDQARGGRFFPKETCVGKGPTSKVNARKQDRPDLVEEVRRLYVDERLTQRAVAELLGIGRGAVVGIMLRNDIPKRKTGEYDRRGPNNNRWRTQNLRYDTLHARVTAARGKPVGCSRCGIDEPDRRYEWANLTGDYENVYDFARMCVPCHRLFDAYRRRDTGEYTSPFLGGGAETRPVTP